MVVIHGLAQNDKQLNCSNVHVLAEFQQGNALSSCFSSNTINSITVYSVLYYLHFCTFCCFHCLSPLSIVLKRCLVLLRKVQHKEAVMCLPEKICV